MGQNQAPIGRYIHSRTHTSHSDILHALKQHQTHTKALSLTLFHFFAKFEVRYLHKHFCTCCCCLQTVVKTTPKSYFKAMIKLNVLKFKITISFRESDLGIYSLCFFLAKEIEPTTFKINQANKIPWNSPVVGRPKKDLDCSSVGWLSCFCNYWPIL